MIALKESVFQELNTLDDEQIKLVHEFISFLKFRSRYPTLQLNRRQMARLYSEFSEEDRQLAEEGLEEYAEILQQEDLK